MILMVSGSLRDLVSPLGYWAAWGAWATVTLVTVRQTGMGRLMARPPVWIMGSYAVLLLGMLIAAVANRDGITAYQALKIAVIAGMFVAMWRLVSRLNWDQLVSAMTWAIGVALLGLAVSKVWSPTGQALVEGPREGSFLAVYGVLWKAGAFFLPVFLADAVQTPRAWARNSVMIAACVFLVLIDGSRTGLLLLGATAVGFVAFLVSHGGWSLARRQFRWFWAALAVLMLLQLLNTGANLGAAGRLGAGGAAAHGSLDGGAAVAVQPAAIQTVVIQPAVLRTAQAQPAAIPSAVIRTVTAQTLPARTAVVLPAADQFERVLEGALHRTFETRIGAGDPARVRLLRASLDQMGACLPLGCGFGAMGADIGTGAWMVVHNAYLAALGDFGLLGLAGLLGFLVAAWLPIRRVLRRGSEVEHGCFIIAAAGSALAYGMALMLNTFTTEMSEWGYLILMLAFAWAPAGKA